jgi:soluble lytic murein transglycosylase-like protein
MIVMGFQMFLSQFQSSSMADVYRYVDENQIIHLTNVPTGSQFKVLIKEKVFHESVRQSAVNLLVPYDTLIAEMSGKYGVDCDLVRAIIKVESNFNHRAVSRKGAKGLMQLMPQTASSLGVSDCFRPETNIDGGIRHLSYLIGLYNGSIQLALAAYNAGEGAVAKYGGIPPYAETKAYVRLVLDKYEQYKKETNDGSLTWASASRRHAVYSPLNTF